MQNCESLFHFCQYYRRFVILTKNMVVKKVVPARTYKIRYFMPLIMLLKDVYCDTVYSCAEFSSVQFAWYFKMQVLPLHHPPPHPLAVHVLIASAGRHETCLPSWRKESSARVYVRYVSSGAQKTKILLVIFDSASIYKTTCL